MRTSSPTSSPTRCRNNREEFMELRRALSLFLGAATLAASVACSDSKAAPAAEDQQGQAAPAVALPNKNGTFKFAVLGDFGTGDRSQYEMGAEMARVQERFKYEIVLLTGDNLYGSDR